jgi:hypothetical protein
VECPFEDCSFLGEGGGLYLSRAGAAGANNTISGNVAAAEGGGVYVYGELSLSSSTVSSNSAVDGGGIYATGGNSASGSLSLSNSTISSNSAEKRGGGLYLEASVVHLLNTTIADNRVTTGTGGGILQESGSQARTKNTIFARNLGVASIPDNCDRPAVSEGHNLEDADTCGFSLTPGDGDIVGMNAILGPLADNGGPTFTHALGEGSPAIDAADNVGCPSVDQRGVLRPIDGNRDRVTVCDIGSYERDPRAPPPVIAGLDTKHLKISFGSHGGENAIDWSGDVAFPSGGVINPVAELVTIKLVSGGVVVFTQTIAPGNFVLEPDGSYRYRSPKNASPELDIRFKPRKDGGWEFKIGVDEVSPTVRDRSAVETTLAVGSKVVTQTLPLTDKGKYVEFKRQTS